MTTNADKPKATPRTGGAAASGTPGAAASGTPGAAKTGRETTARGRAGGDSNMTGWLSLVVAVLLLALQVFYALNATSIDGGALEGYRSVITFGSLILGLAGAVLALVGMAQHRRPRWPSTVGLAIGTYAFIIAVASWIGGLMNAGA